jgi:hypothetical protein
MTDLPGYELDAPLAQSWTDKAFDMLEAGTMQASATVQHDIAKLFVEGPCPRCGPHRVRTNQIETIVAAGAGMKILEAVRNDADESDMNYSGDSKTPRLSVTTGNEVVCGKLQSADEQQIVIKVNGESKERTIGFGDVKNLAPVADCES